MTANTFNLNVVKRDVLNQFEVATRLNTYSSDLVQAITELPLREDEKKALLAKVEAIVGEVDNLVSNGTETNKAMLEFLKSS